MQLTFSRQLSLLTIFTAGALGAVIALTAWRLDRLSQHFDDYQRSQESVRLLLNIKVQTLTVSRADPMGVDTAKQLAATDELVRNAGAQLTPLLDSDSAKIVNQEIATNWSGYLKQFQSAVKIAETSPQDALTIPDQIYSLQLRPMIQALDVVVQQQNIMADAQRQIITQDIVNVLRSVLLPLILAAIGAIAFQVMFGRRLQRRLRTMEHAAQVLSTGDLTSRLQESPDELGQIAAACNRFIDALGSLLAEVQREVEQSRKDTALLRQQAETVSGYTRDQSEGLSGISTAMDAMASSITLVVDSSSHASMASRSAAELTRSAENGSAESLTQLRHLQSSVNSAELALTELGTSIGMVDAVSRLIEDIAGQTNLLALNAAIEAARAGETGRGFAVVADEVRKLSERTRGATTEIGTILTGLVSRLDSARQAMSDAHARAEGEVSQAEATSQLMREVEASMGSVLIQMRTIEEATQAQAHTGNNIRLQVSTIHQLAQQSAKAMLDTREEAESLTLGAERLAAATARFKIG